MLSFNIWKHTPGIKSYETPLIYEHLVDILRALFHQGLVFNSLEAICFNGILNNDFGRGFQYCQP